MCIRDRYKEEAEKKVIETNQRLDKTEEKMEQIKTGVEARMEKEEQNNQVRVMAIRQENNDQLDSINSSLNCKFSEFHKTVENLKSQCDSQAEKLDSLQQIQTNFQCDEDRISARSACSSHHVYPCLLYTSRCV